AALAAYGGLLALSNPAGVSPWAMAAVFVAALTSSIAGFAFSAICGAMLFHLLDDPVHAVEIMMICSIAGQALMVWSLRRDIAWRGLAPFVAGAAVGLPLGVYCLLHCRPVLYVHIIGALLVLYAAFMIFRRPIVVRRQHALFDGLAGFLGGVTGGAAAFPGAFVTIWCGFKGLSKERQRGIYQPFILIVQLAALAVLALSSLGAGGRPFDFAGIVYMPAMLLGSSCGMACFKWLNDRQFARAVNLLLIASGLSFLL
ncbi:MAG TPA: sulfite exporter TauE/SafE family protein, partial [Reyranella sp.]